MDFSRATLHHAKLVICRKHLNGRYDEGKAPEAGSPDPSKADAEHERALFFTGGEFGAGEGRSGADEINRNEPCSKLGTQVM